MDHGPWMLCSDMFGVLGCGDVWMYVYIMYAVRICLHTADVVAYCYFFQAMSSEAFGAWDFRGAATTQSLCGAGG